MSADNLTSTYDATDDVRFGGPDCGTDGCQREVGHIGDHRRAEPSRIQRKRTKGWRMPENTVYVGRPSRWGNPFHVAGPADHLRRSTTEVALTEFRLFVADLARVGWLEPLRGHDLMCWCDLSDPCHADVLLELANR